MILTRIQEAASRYPEMIAIQMKTGDRYQQFTYRDLIGSVASVARALTEQGIGKGERIALLSENRPEWAAAYFGSSSYVMSKLMILLYGASSFARPEISEAIFFSTSSLAVIPLCSQYSTFGTTIA